MKTWQKIKQSLELKNRYLMREQVIDGIRHFFKAKRFHEVETPLLVKTPGAEPYLEVFSTNLEVANRGSYPAFLVTSPEYNMKKLLAAGLGNIFQVCKSFRNGEGISTRHNSEFTILEWYRVEADYERVMTDCEELFMSLLQSIKPVAAQSGFLEYQGTKYNLSRPWTRISVADAFNEFAQIDTDTLLDRARLLTAGREKGYQVTDQTTWEEIYNQIFLNEIEPALAKLRKPVILYDYPVAQAALSRLKVSDPRFAERFEWYLAGLELGNAFSELTDFKEQRARFLTDLQERQKLGKTEFGLDEDLIVALQQGLPKCAGIAVGVDRLVMLLADAANLADTLFFPLAELFDLE